MKGFPMADITAHHASRRSFSVGSVFKSIWNGLLYLGEHNSRVQKLNRLMDLSDEELARRGLKREDIVRHVFSDMLYV